MSRISPTTYHDDFTYMVQNREANQPPKSPGAFGQPNPSLFGAGTSEIRFYFGDLARSRWVDCNRWPIHRHSKLTISILNYRKRRIGDPSAFADD